MASEEAFKQVDLKLSPTDQAYVAIQTRLFDDFLIQTPVDQVVLGAVGKHRSFNPAMRAHFGRYLDPVSPRAIPDVMRAFLVTATKTG